VQQLQGKQRQRNAGPSCAAAVDVAAAAMSDRRSHHTENSPRPAILAKTGASEVATRRSPCESERQEQWRPHGAAEENIPLLREREGDSAAHALCEMDKSKQIAIKNKRFLIATDESAAKCQSKRLNTKQCPNAQSNRSPTPSEIIANIKIFCWLVKNPCKYNILRSNFLTSF